MNAITALNEVSDRILGTLGTMFWQSSLLIVVVFVFDQALRNRLRPGVRYALWMVALLKLVLPPAMALPSGVAWWLREPVVASVSSPGSYGGLRVLYGPRPEQKSNASLYPFRKEEPARLSAASVALLLTTAISLGLFSWAFLR
jgi:hypothetical protein